MPFKIDAKFFLKQMHTKAFAKRLLGRLLKLYFSSLKKFKA